jgi:hypothetical protein
VSVEIRIWLAFAIGIAFTLLLQRIIRLIRSYPNGDPWEETKKAMKKERRAMKQLDVHTFTRQVQSEIISRHRRQ